MKRLGIALVITATLGLMFVAAPSASAACKYPPCPPPTVGVGNTHPTPGGTTGLSGARWCPGSTVQIFLDGKLVGTAIVDSTGHFTFNLHIPPNISPGHHTITFTGLDSTCDNTVTLTQGIVIGGAAASGGNLPFTGSNISVGVLLLIALLIIGATSLVAGRRRKMTTTEK
jgi:hypothetical protein